ncbi:MAG: hypothetical protein U1F71_21700 [Verrucomicrobiaceae bacterium]
MWTPQTVKDRIATGSLLPDSMFESLDADSLLDRRDDSSDDDWVRAAESLQHEWDRYPDASRATPAIDAVREAAFIRTFDAAGGHHDLAATVSDDFELICRRALIGVEIPFITALEQAYDAHQFPC